MLLNTGKRSPANKRAIIGRVPSTLAEPARVRGGDVGKVVLPYEGHNISPMSLAETPAREGGNNNGTSRNWWDILRALAPVAGGAIVGGVLGGKRGSLVGSVGMAKALESYTEQKRIAELAKQEAERKQREADIAQQKADTEERKAAEIERKNEEKERLDREKEIREAAAKEAERKEKARQAGYDPETGFPLPVEKLSPQQQAEYKKTEAHTEYLKAGAKLRLTPKPETPRIASEYRLSIKDIEGRLNFLKYEDDTPEKQAKIEELTEDLENLRTGLRNLLGGAKKPEQESREFVGPEKPKSTAATLATPPPPTATPLSRYQGGKPVAELGLTPTPTTPTPMPTPTPRPTGIQSLAPAPTRTPIPTPIPGPTAQAQPDTITGSDFDALVQRKLSENPSLTRDKVESALMLLLQERGIRLVR